MKAMVLAAGLGTRLQPLTNSRPKALVELGGRTLLEITLKRLRDFGIRETIINVHHFADQIAAYLSANHDFGMELALSREDDLLLDTGGGLKKAGWFFRNATEPFFLHNVDVVSNIDFGRMLEAHQQSNRLATVAVQRRTSSRYLLFDSGFKLCGRRRAHQPDQLTGKRTPVHALAFTGIHVISTRMLTMIREEGAFSILDCYLRLAGEGQDTVAFSADEYYWRDLGRLEDLQRAEEDVKNGVL
jgi:NDP-sugar pyrophosphorylase family protein